MNIEAHLAAGWVLAHCGASETRRFRALVTIAAIAPDLDVISYLWGERAYSTYHHAVGHNVFFSLACSGVSMFLFRQAPWKMLLFTQLAFYSHYFGDYYFTRFPLEFFWPVSHHGYINGYSIGLDHPINLFFSYFSFVIFIATGIIYGRTPVELLSPELDCRIINLFRRRPLTCHVCGGGANERCATCGRPACMQHGRISRHFHVVCKPCHAARAASLTSGVNRT